MEHMIGAGGGEGRVNSKRLEGSNYAKQIYDMRPMRPGSCGCSLSVCINLYVFRAGECEKKKKKRCHLHKTFFSKRAKQLCKHCIHDIANKQ